MPQRAKPEVSIASNQFSEVMLDNERSVCTFYMSQISAVVRHESTRRLLLKFVGKFFVDDRIVV